MAIIIKKRHVTQTRAPAPVVPDPILTNATTPTTPLKPLQAPAAVPDDRPIAKSIEQLWAAPLDAMRAPDPTTCERCDRQSPFPCQGRDDMCVHAFVRLCRDNIEKTKRQEAAHEGL